MTGTYTYVHNIRVPGHAPRPPDPAARPGRVRHRRPDPLGRRELDRTHPEREGPAEGELPRGRRTARVRRDPGRRAAEGQVRRTTRFCPATATSSSRCGRKTPPARPSIPRSTRATSTPRSHPPRRRSRRATRTGTTATHRSARPAAWPTSRADGAVIYTNGQDSYVARPRVAAVLGLPANKVRFIYVEGGGSFGGHPARYDAPPAVALISQLAGAPVRLQYMRWDEQGWDAYGPSSLEDIRAGIDAKRQDRRVRDDEVELPGRRPGEDPRDDRGAARRDTHARADPRHDLGRLARGELLLDPEPARHRQGDPVH